MANKKVSQGLKRAQSRLLNQNTKKILNNVLLLYVVLIASIADLLYMVSTGSHINVIIFILVAYVTSLFSKNMTVVLLVALAITNIYQMGKSIIVKEGFEEGAEEDAEEDAEKDTEEDAEEGAEEDVEEDAEENTVKKKDKAKDKDKDKDKELPEEYKKALEQLSDPETARTIEGLKSLEPLVERMQSVVNMLK